MADDVTLSIGVDASAVNKSLNNLKSTLLKVGAAAAAAFAGKKIVEAASRQEDAINKLNQSLVRSGEYSKEASEDLQAYASALQDVSTVGDEAILEQLAFAKSLGRTNEEAKKLVEAAVELTAVTDMSLESAVKNLSKTYAGLTGELGEALPFLRELTQEQLKSGAATEAVLKQFGGAARGELQTFSGALAQMSNTFGDLLEEIGFFITRSPLVIGAITGLRSIFVSLIEFLKTNGDTIRVAVGGAISFLIKGFSILASNVLPPLIEILLVLVKVLDGLQRAAFDAVRSFVGFDFVKRSINTLTRAVLALADTVLEGLLGAFQQLAKFVDTEIPSIENAIGGIRDKIEDLASADTGSALSEFVNKAADARDAAGELVEETLRSIQDGAKSINYDKLADDISKGLSGKIEIDPKLGQKTEKSFFDLASDFGNNTVDTIKANIGSAAATFGKQFLNILVQGTKKTSETNKLIANLKLELENTADLEKRRELEKQITEAQEAQVKAQKDAAYEFTSEIGAFVADVFLPGAGQFVKLFLELAKDPEAFAQFIEGFVDSLPEIINALAEAMPIVAEALAENADKIALAIGYAFIKLTEGSINAILRILEIALTNIFREFSNLIISAGEQFVFKILDGASTFISKLIENIKGAFDVGGSNKVGGTLGSVTEGIKSAFGFAEGGIVPPGFPNDSGLAAVTSGEMVLNESQQQNLFKLLNQGGFGGSQMLTVNLVMNQEILAKQILEINRDNLRTA